jgi:hypothetical protein
MPRSAEAVADDLADLLGPAFHRQQSQTEELITHQP